MKTSNMIAENYYHLNGTIRSRLPAETLEFLKPKLKQFGITRVANVTGLDKLDIPVFVSIRPNSKHLATSQGKSADMDLAKISAIMESIEGYHAENPRPPAFHGSYLSLKETHSLIDPSLFSIGFFNRNLQETPFYWTEGWDCLNKKTIYVPHTLINLNSSNYCDDRGKLFSSSNGLASGNSLSEAICHGLYEVIERDAVFKWQMLSEQERAKTMVDIDSVDDPALKALIDKFKQAEVDLTIWEATSELNVPTFYCIGASMNPFGFMGSYFGCGTHLDKNIALSRAITEVAQSRATLISGSRDDVYPERYEAQRKQHSHNVLKYHQSEKSLSSEGKKYQQCCQQTLGKSFVETIDKLTNILAKGGYEQIVVIDHTKKEFNVPVAQIIIPEMKFNGFRV